MGRVKNLLTKIANKATSYLETVNTNSNEPITLESKVDHYEMPFGIKKTNEELIEENKMIISSLDPKINFILQLIDELSEDELDSLKEFSSDPMIMKLWLAHYSYKNQIDSFYNLIKNSEFISSNKKIRCITDLPLQKKLLN